jgi:hypothetical protein
MVFRIGPLHTGVLNVADIAITVGAIAAAALTVTLPDRAPRSQSADDGAPQNRDQG